MNSIEKNSKKTTARAKWVNRGQFRIKAGLASFRGQVQKSLEGNKRPRPLFEELWYTLKHWGRYVCTVQSLHIK